MKYYDGKTPNKAQIAKLLETYNDKSGLTSFDKYWLKGCNRINDKALAAMASGMKATRCAPATAKGALIRRKGGVVPGGKVFI